MRIGIVLLPERRWAQDADRWRAVEAWGFDHAWTYDHLAWRSLADGPWLASVPQLAAAAAVTERIRLGTWVANPNFRHPVPFAKDVMGLDDISGGRLLLGVGAGGGGLDAEVLGEPVTALQRAERFAEFVALMDRLLTDPVTDHEGPWYRAKGARMLPGCVQQPRVPFVVAANGPRAMRVAARFGQGWATTGPSLPALGEGSVDPQEWWEGLAGLVERFEGALVDAGVESGARDRYLSLDTGPEFSMSSVDTLRRGVERAAALGFTDVVVHWPRPDGVYAGDEGVLREVAEALPELRSIG